MTILLTGGHGFIGTALRPKLIEKGYDVFAPAHKEVELKDPVAVRKLFEKEKYEAVIHLAGKVGGILANKTYPGEFMYENLMMNTLFLEEAKKAKIDRLIYSFCGCSYGSNVPNPITETSLFTGLPDENAMYYSIGKAASHFQLLAYRKEFGFDWVSLVPGNVYGPFDNFTENNSHVVPALIRKFLFAKKNSEPTVPVWGSGRAVRDFIYVDDVAESFVVALEKHHDAIPINVSVGVGISIRDTVDIVNEVSGFKGEVVWDKTKPDGHPIKIFDTKRMRDVLNFEPKVSLKSGLIRTMNWLDSKLAIAKL